MYYYNNTIKKKIEVDMLKDNKTLVIDTKSGVPVYKQIVQWVEYNMSIGKFRAGDRLPTVYRINEYRSYTTTSKGDKYKTY